jgi:hypothetical protein
MTSSSSLYGSVTTQNTSSTNSTSLYGEAGTPIPDSNGNVVVRGDLYVLSGNILTTATTGNIFPTNATTINLGNAATTISIGAASGTTTINNALTAGGTVTAPGADFGNITIGVATDNTITTTSGDLNITATGNNGVNITSGSDAPTLITRNTTNTNTGTRSLALSVQTSGTPAVGFGNSLEWQVETAPGTTKNAGYAVVNITDLTPGSEDFSMGFGLMQNGAAADNKMSLNSAGNLAFDGDLTVGGVNINLQPSANFLYSENDNRTNRPEFQSTSGNSSGLRVRAPNTGTSASSTFSVNNSSDSANTEFLALQARGSALGDTFRFLTGEYIANVFSASNKSISFTDYTNTYATVNPAGPTIGTDLTTKTYVDNAVATTGVTSITGTANQVIASSPTGAVTLSLPQSIATTSNVTFADVIVGDDLTVQGNNVNLAQATTIGYSENNDRLNRPQIQSTTGNSSGLRIAAPNTGTSAFSGLTVTNSSDTLNNDFLTIQSRGSALSSTYRVLTGKYTAGVQGASNASIVLTDNTNTYATINPAGPTVGTDLTTKTYVDGLIPVVPTYDTNVAPVAGGAELDLREIVGATFSIVGSTKFLGGTNVTVSETSPNEITISAPDTNTTYDFNATSTTGGANLNLVGSDATTDTVKLTNGGHITATYTSGTEVTLGSDATDANTASAIVARDASGNFSAGTVTANLANASYVLGQLIATPTTAYVPPTSALTTVSGSNGLAIASSTGNSPTVALRYSTGDTTAAANTSAAIIMAGTSGTSTAPAGNLLNQVSGSINFDGYTAGTSNNFANQIATANAGGGTTALSPLQIQGYARQAFTNSTTITTAVTGASGTGTTATLTFTLQNTAPYIIGQTVTIAGMTPSGYNGTYVLTGVTAASVSYANATTGFTSGGTIGAANTVTAAGMGFRVRGYANSTNMTAQNRFNFYDHTASAATFKSNAYTFANEVITGATLTATNYMTLGATTGSVNQNTFTIKNTAGTSTYASFVSTGTDITGAGLSTITRTTVGTPTVVESRPSMNIQLIRSDQAAPTSGDGTGFRARTGGSNGTIYTISDLSSNYSSTGDTQWALGLANGDQTGATFTSVQTIASRVSQTTIAAGTPSATPGASTVSTVATFAPTSTTLAASGTTYANFASTTAQITNSGRTTISRTTPGTGLLLTQQTAAAGPANNESIDFRLGVAGTSTSSNFGRFDGTYKTSGDHEIGLSVSDDSFVADTDRIYIGSRASTKLQATPSGGGSVSTIVTVTDTNITMARPVVFPTYTAAAANAITGAVGWQISISDSPINGGKMAYWDTTNARWSYIDTNTAV